MKYFIPLIGCLLIALPGWTQLSCRSFDYRQQQLSKAPSLAASAAAIEDFTRRQLAHPSVIVSGESAGASTSTISRIIIPVVVHIVYNTSAENISDAQVQSQI